MSEAQDAPVSGTLIETRDAARACVRAIPSAVDLALDLESDGMFRYRARVCVLQLSFSGQNWIIDTLEPGLLSELEQALSAAAPRKLVHDLSFDARLLFAHGICLREVFDTAVAARFLGYQETGLASLVAKLLRVRLPKHMQQTDWGLRPLDEEALRYLAGDVAHLHALAEQLAGELDAQGIAEETREETQYLLDQAQQASEPDAPWQRIKGALQLSPGERARLYELAEEREQIAQELDLPPGRVLSSDRLMRIARAGELVAPPVGEGLAPDLRARFADALSRAKLRVDVPPEQLPDVPILGLDPSEIARRKRRRAALQAFRKREAEARDVIPQVVLPGHCLNDLAASERLDLGVLQGLLGFGACRIERYGGRLLAELGPAWAK